MVCEKRRLLTIKSFDNDYKKIRKKHIDTEDFLAVFQALIDNNQQLLKSKYRDHALTGSWKGYRELHVQPNLLLIYWVDGLSVSLVLVRAGNHDELFSNAHTNSKIIRKYSEMVSNTLALLSKSKDN
ncbi:type II toxin-antitoxin system YafQ family toxin [Gardnerella vaginalis]|uniref:type II toxin-antitoxin system YafQ family toxin n=1 Tax=Gardnerella TaxID=2701 RepID=UPI0039EFCC47